jgi:hypothetical protein
MTPPKIKSTAVTAKGSSSTWAFVYLKQHLPIPNAIDWDATRDQPTKELNLNI